MHGNARSRLEAATPGRNEVTRGRAGDTPAVDLVHLGRFTLGNRALELEVLAIFEGQIGSHIIRLEDADSHKSWREAAHTIKGTAWAIGAWRLGRLAEDAERLDTASPREVRQALVADLVAAADDVLSFIAGSLARETPVRLRPAAKNADGDAMPARANEAP